MLDLSQPIDAGRDVLRLAISIPNRAPWQAFGFLHQREARGVVAGSLGVAKGARLQQGHQQRLERVARADGPSSNPVDAGVEEIQADVGAGEQFVPNEFGGDGLERVIQRDDVVAVPADATTDVEEDFRHIHQRGGKLVRDAFGRVEMPGVETEQHLIFDRVAHVELVRTDHVALAADAEEFALDRIQVVLRIELFRENSVQRIRQALTRREAIHRRILVAVWNPDVGDRR